MMMMMMNWLGVFQEAENGSAAADSGSGQPCENLGLLCEWLFEATGNERLSEILAWLIGTPVKVLIIVAAALVINKWLKSRITKYATKIGTVTQDHDQLISDRSSDRSQERAATLSSLMRSTTTVIVFGIAAIMILETIGFGVVTLIAGAGVAGLAIAFGAQSVVEDVLKGIFMIIEDQFGVGDRIDVGQVEGYVERVTLRTTVLRAPDGRVWHIPNSEIHRVANETQNWSRAVIDIGVSYSADLRQASAVLEQAARSLAEEDEWKDHILVAPVVQGVQSLGDDAVMLRVATRLEHDHRRAFERALRERLKDAMDEAGLEMPNRQLDVWLQRRPEAA
ncbi:MAG: mechanosensitive ion channel family protein [Acidobacteria bacterium]|nr:mechanosensitive ion channel family protein [Acidobacteriota bacterium]